MSINKHMIPFEEYDKVVGPSATDGSFVFHPTQHRPSSV